MITNRGNIKELSIFDNFFYDTDLPKFKPELKVAEDGNMDGTFDPTVESWGVVSGSNPSSFNGNVINVTGRDLGDHESRTVLGRQRQLLAFEPTFRNWIKMKMLQWFVKPEKLSTKKPLNIDQTQKISILEFFTTLVGSIEELTPVAKIAEHYKGALIQAQTMGQKALVERYKDMIEVVRGEAHLIGAKLNKYVTEKHIVDLYEKVGEDKNLKLTWVKNFGRVIPEEVYNIKKEIDQRKIFDNYAILHYDPKNNGEKLTKKEVEDKKDPILFGLIMNSRKLYYIADWKDEYCDLTLEEMFKELGGKALTINNRSVKTFINKVKVEDDE